MRGVAAERRRQRWLDGQGYRVVRVAAVTVLRAPAAAVRSIMGALERSE